MTNLLRIKPYIHDFIEELLDPVFANKVYWLGERKIVPEYPYCLLNVIAENKDKRTSHHQGKITDIDTRECITTRYKTCTVTVGIYNAWVEDTYSDMDMDEAKEFAYKQIDCLEGAFENYPINNKFSIQNISSIRPLHEVVDGGYMYRYEFDLTIGYNEKYILHKDYGQSVETNLAIKDPNGDIEYPFKVTITNNDTIIIENNIRS